MIKYILVTPARNEEARLEQTIRSIVAQTHRPDLWYIVDDGSTDRTAEIVRGAAKAHPWISLVQRPLHVDRSFAAKVQAFNAAYEQLQSVDFDVIGNMDADVSIEPRYMAFLMSRFDEDESLGVAGTPFVQDNGYDSARDSFEGENYVSGGCQMFRRACFEEVGGYVPNREGGIDWIAVMTARMKGWKVRCFPELRYHHHRILGTAEKSQLAAIFNYGERAYFLGGSPIWQTFRVVYRIMKPPFLFGGLALGAGYCWAWFRRTKRPVSLDLIRFCRQDQMNRLRAIFSSILRFKKLNSFSVAAGSKRTS
jgi:biofilm PGA synthesis N-glycosyltransferase PgaC